MEQYIISWQDYGEERRRTVKYHLDRLKTLLLPTNVNHANGHLYLVDQGLADFLERTSGGHTKYYPVCPGIYFRSTRTSRW